MKQLRLFALASIAVLVPTGGLLLACGDDDTVVNGGSDSGFPETGTVDANADTGTGDGGSDADADAPFTPETFAPSLAETICSSLSRCCYGSDVADGGAVNGGDGGVTGIFDRGACGEFYRSFGFEGSATGSDRIQFGNVEIDQAKANDCIAKVKALPCDLTGNVFQDTRAACFAVYKGKQAIGQPCRSPIECASGYCNGDIADSGVEDAGAVVGVCTALAGDGGGCGLHTTDPGVSEEACSTRGSGDTKLQCDYVESFGATPQDPPTFKDPSEWTCRPALANGEVCFTSQWCASGYCNEATFTCESPTRIFTPQGSCAGFVR